jgi:hypothetical protein
MTLIIFPFENKRIVFFYEKSAKKMFYVRKIIETDKNLNLLRQPYVFAIGIL